MAGTSMYRNNRGERQASIETSYSSGMSFSNGTIDDGYVKTLVNFDFSEEKKVLVPRAGLRTTEFVFPDIYTTMLENTDFLDDTVCIKDMKECIEDGVTYVQCIFGKPDDEDSNKGKIWVSTFRKKTDQNLETEFTIDDETFQIAFSDSLNYSSAQECVFYSTSLQEIHGLRLKDDSRTGFPVGNFAFGNSYYFFALITENNVQVPKLYRTVFKSPALGSEARYCFEEVTVRSNTASEAVLYGYNMLSKTPYTFSNTVTGSVITLEGILPYASESSSAELVMTPRTNQKLNYRCYYSAPSGGEYEFVWEWRTVDDDVWTQVGKQTLIVATDAPSTCSFIAPTANIMVRVSAYNTADEDYGTDEQVVEHAMTVGFDFTIDEHGTTTNLSQVNYELGHSTGMTVWKNRLILWGLTEDPTVVFVSDMNEPGFFPYPNNITVFDNPVISVLEFMDKLIVFTTDKCYQVSLSDDGTSFNTTVIQANLHIEMWDKHLIQAVRNMVFFKSGNYYYMMVPKSSSTTGELTLAPISTPMTEFFNHFMVNVEQLFRDTYGNISLDSVQQVITYDLITYYNFLDYEDVHNMYVFTWSGSDTLIHLDIMYNTVNRYWKISVFEEPNLLYVYKHDATQRGTYATTSVMSVKDNVHTVRHRVVQLYKYDPLYVRDFYVPDEVVLNKDDDDTFEGCSVTGSILIFPANSTLISSGNITINSIVIDDFRTKFSENLIGLLGSHNYIGGFKLQDVVKGIQNVLQRYGLYFKYRNYQFLDTGFRTDNTHLNKRYRELQLQINNIDSKDLNFGTEFFVDGDIRKSVYKYEVTQLIEEMTNGYATAYVEPFTFLDVDVDKIDKSNIWIIEQGLHPEINLWKVRMQVSGKGTAPRLKLCSRNEVRYQLMGINWIYRLKNMR